MPGVLPAHILKHLATPVSYVEGVEGDEWIEGEPGEGGPQAVEGVPFPCVLFLPGPGGEEANAFKPRTVTRPTLLYNPERDDASPVLVGHEDELLIDAPELAPWTGAARQRWQVEGSSQPFGPPGSVFGVMATLRRVAD